MHGSGVRRPEQARRGVLAARRLLDLGHDDWSRASLIEHLRRHGSGQPAAWHRGFLALLVAEEAITRSNADRVLAAINPGHWAVTSLSDAHLALVRWFDAAPRQTTLGGMDLFSQKSLGELPPEFGLAASSGDEPLTARDVIEDWLDQIFFQLDDDRASLQADHDRALDEGDLRGVEGDWSEALLRSSELLIAMGWRVRFGEDDFVDDQGRIVTLAQPRPEAARMTLQTLARASIGQDCPMSRLSPLHTNVASEMAACVVGWALGLKMTRHSFWSVRSALLASDCEPSLIYSQVWAESATVAESLCAMLGLDVTDPALS